MSGLVVTEKQRILFEDFLACKDVPLSLYFRLGPFSTYIRRGIRNINGRNLMTICRANTTNKKRNHLLKNFRRTGLYSELDTFIADMARRHGYLAMEVENVLNPHLVLRMPSYGYQEIESNGMSDIKSFWKEL